MLTRPPANGWMDEWLVRQRCHSLFVSTVKRTKIIRKYISLVNLNGIIFLFCQNQEEHAKEDRKHKRHWPVRHQ